MQVPWEEVTAQELLWAKWRHVVCTSHQGATAQLLLLWAGMAVDGAGSCMTETGAWPWDLLPARVQRQKLRSSGTEIWLVSLPTLAQQIAGMKAV